MAESDCLKAASGTHDPAGGPASGPELDANWQDDWHPRPRPGLISAGAAAEEPEPGREPGQAHWQVRGGPLTGRLARAGWHGGRGRRLPRKPAGSRSP